MTAKAPTSSTKRARQKPMPKPTRAFQAPPQVCEELQRIGKHRFLVAGTILFKRGDQPHGLSVVASGRFALSAGDDPTQVTRIAEKGSLLGLPSTVRDAPYSLTAEAVTDCDIYVISPAELRDLLTSNPTVGMAVLAILADEVFEMRRIFVFQA